MPLSSPLASAVTGLPVRPTVASFMNHWLAHVAWARLRFTTARTYAGVSINLIAPVLGQLRLSAMTSAHLEQAQVAWQRAGVKAPCVARNKVEGRLRARAEELARVQQSLPKEITQQSARIGELVATMGTGDGKARELAQAAFQSESAKLAALEQRQRSVARDHQSLAGSQVELEWVASTLSKFSSVWGELSNANRARLLQALLKSVRVDQVTGEVEMEFYSPVAQGAA